MQEATAETVLGDFGDATFTHRGVTSTFYQRDGGFFVRTEGPDGQLAEYRVAYTFGVTPLQQYLVPFPGGRYQALSIAWDARPTSVGGQRWFHLYPDADVGPGSPLHWTRLSQNWNTGCAECHSTGLEKGFDLASLSYETTWSEIDVSCEACHGPGSVHVVMAEALSSSGETRARGDWGLVVDFGDPRRMWNLEIGATTAALVTPPKSPVELDACASCHSRRAQIGRHVVGDALLDSYQVSLLQDGLYHPDGQIDDEVYVYGSFVQSKMYAAGVTCSDCHDPHSLELRAEGNALCTRCHSVSHYDDPSHHFHEPASDGAGCVECHMPSSTYMVVDPRRDHSLRIPRPDLTEAIGVPNACSGCHVERSAEWAAEAVERWYGSGAAPPHFGVVIHDGRSRNPEAVAPLVELAGDATRPAIVRASALSLLAGYARASAVDAIRVGLTDAEPLVRFGALVALDGRPAGTVLTLAYPLLDDPVRSVRIRATRLLVAVPPEEPTPEQASAIARGRSEYERAQQANEDHPSAWVNLGDLHATRGMASEAEAAYRTALTIDPTDLVALLNLADLQRAFGRDDLSEDVLFEALAIHPETSEILHAIGLLKVRQGDVAGALDWLKRAAGSRPVNPRFAYVYGVALASTGEMAGGVRVLDGALEAHPYDRDLLSALATYSRDRGETEAAIGYAERLVEMTPEDAGARALLAQLRDQGS